MADILSKATPDASPARRAARTLLRSLVVGLMAFLTVVDLFAAQALLPSLTTHYGVAPAAMGLAVNACTFGMAAAGLAVALFGRGLDQRWGIVASLALLAVPTALLSQAPSLEVFAVLRVTQGLFMATAFSLTLALLGDNLTGRDAAGAVAAYITGNVASNLVGRLIATSVADHASLAAAFYVFAGLNLTGAVLALAAIKGMPARLTASETRPDAAETMSAWRTHLSDPVLCRAFGIGFCVLFAFIGTFTYVNFVLSRAPLSVGMMQLGFIYFVFLPSIVTTPFAGELDRLLGTARALWVSLGLAAAGLPLLVSDTLMPVLAGMVLVAVGTFAAQAIATGFVGRRANVDRGAASGIYLAAYYMGGLVGTAALGPLFDGFGWPATVAGIGASLMLAAILAGGLDRARADLNDIAKPSGPAVE